MIGRRTFWGRVARFGIKSAPFVLEGTGRSVLDLMAYWRWDNYVRDLDEGAAFHFNSNQTRLHSAIELGERLWLVTGRRGPGGIEYVLVACLTVAAKTFNAPDYKYGRYRLWGDTRKSKYFSADGPDMTDLLLRLEFDTGTRIQSKDVIGQSLQTIRSLVARDVATLLGWSKTLRPESRAYDIADEAALEKSFDSSEDAVRQTVLGHHSGVSERRRQLLQRSYRRNRVLVEELHGLYAGRCQLCGFDPPVLYGVSACCGHHVVYLSRGGKDELPNLMLVCPNHHEIIHATSAVFDFSDLHYVFPNGRREPLVLNRHFAKAR